MSNIIVVPDEEVMQAICGYVLSHEDDILEGINDFDELMIVLNMIYRARDEA